LTHYVLENRPLRFVVSGEDDSGNPIIYTPSNLPNGATFDIETQTFFWRPQLYDAAGAYGIVFTANGQPEQTATVAVQDVAPAEWYDTFLTTFGYR
jgi:hypothetical protein